MAKVEMKYWQRGESLQKVSSRLANGLEKTANICGILSGIACWGLTILVFLTVIARYVFHYGIPFAGDMATYFACFAIFIGSCYTQWKKEHIKIEIIESRLSTRAQQWVQVVALFVALVVSIAYMYYTSLMVWDSGVRKLSTMTSLQIPLVIPQIPMVIGWFFLIIIVLFQLVKAVKGLCRTGVEKEK